MNFIFDFFGNIFGYILWFFYLVVKNYGIALILFTIVTKAIVFPLSIRQQKSMAVNARMAGKQKELQKKYGSDKQKYNEELQKLYAKEGVNPASGCLTSIFPMFIMLGIYYAVINPLQNTLHLASDAVTKATTLLNSIPGIGNINSQYPQLSIVSNFDYLQNHLTMFSATDLGKIESYSKGFHFLGLDLLQKPQDNPILILIPVLCFVSSVLVQYFTTKLNGNPMADQQGCMKVAMYLLPLMSVWFAYIMPAAVGFYWIISTVLGYAQTVVLYRYYNINEMSAKQEAQRIALRDVEEAKVKEIPNYTQKKLAAQVQAKEKAEKKPAAQNQSGKSPAQKSGQQKPAGSSSSSKKKGNKSGNSNYLGSSKTVSQKGGQQNKPNNGQ